MAHTGGVANLLGPKHVAQLGAYIREQRENAQYALKISAETLYVQAGLLDGAPEHSEAYTGDADGTRGEDAAASSRVIAAITADQALTRRQKQILREIYESFRAETAAAAAAPTSAASGETE